MSYNRLRLLLGASLVANLLFIGLMLGFRASPFAVGDGPTAGQMVQRIRALPIGDRIHIGQALRRHRDSIRQAAVGTQRAAAAALAAIGARPYDPTRVAAAMAALRDARLRQQEANQTALMEALPHLSDAARQALAAPPPARRESASGP